MKLVDILDRGRVIFRLEKTTRADVLRELVERGFVPPEANTELGQGDLDHIVRLLEERERLSSTGLKDGLAIPHAKLERIDSLIACLGVHERGVEFGALDGLPSKIFIVLLAPESAGGLHLKALARISRLFSDARFHDRILQAQGADELWNEIVAEDMKY